MGFAIDLFIYTLMSLLWFGKKEKFETPRGNFKIDDNLVTILLPVKNEKEETIEYTIKNLLNQTIKPKIYIIINKEDEKTISIVNKLKNKFNNSIKIVIIDKVKNKAEALNKAIKHVNTKYILIIDAGDAFENIDAIENLLKVAEKGYDAVNSTLKANDINSWWKKLVNIEMTIWSTELLPKIKKRFGFIPLSGTGLLIRTNVIKKIGFPNTLAEDAALGTKLSNVAITDSSIVLYNLPDGLWDHLRRQRARWMAGYLQNLIKVQRGKLIFISPISRGLTPISYLLILLLLLININISVESTLIFKIFEIISLIFLFYCVYKYFKYSNLRIKNLYIFV